MPSASTSANQNVAPHIADQRVGNLPGLPSRHPAVTHVVREDLGDETAKMLRPPCSHEDECEEDEQRRR